MPTKHTGEEGEVEVAVQCKRCLHVDLFSAEELLRLLALTGYNTDKESND